jgi:vitamin B12 transporter
MRAFGKHKFGGAALRWAGASSFALSLAVAGAASAQTIAAESDAIVITGVAKPIALEKIGNVVTVVSGEQLVQGGYNYVSDALRQVPGLAVSRTGPFGGQTQIRIRGAEGNHTLVLLDGVDVSPAGSGETDVSTLLSGDVERIEVLRGPQSGLYGSNALAGVVNVISARRIDGVDVGASAEYGSFGTYQLEGFGGVGNGKSYLSGGAVIHETNGFDSSAAGTPGAYYDGDDEADSNWTGTLRAGVEVSPNLRLDAFTRYVSKDSDLDGGFPVVQDTPAFARTTDAASAASATLSLLDNNWVTVGRVSKVNNTQEGRDPSSPFGTYGSKSDRTKYELKSSLSFGAAPFLSTITAFGEHKVEGYRDTHPFGPPVRLERELNGYGLEYRAEIGEQLYLSATGRHDNNDVFEDADTYGVSASWVVPNSGFRLHASYGTGATNPSFFEQFGFVPGVFNGNPLLTPEEARGYDAGVEYTFLDGKAQVDLTYFNADLKDEIKGFGLTSVNDTGTSERSGAEVYARFAPATFFDIVATYTYLEASDPDGTVEVRRPKNQASIDANYRFLEERASINVGVTYNGTRYDSDFSSFPTVKARMDSYTVARATLAYKLTPQVEVYGRVENAFDENYQEVLGYATPERAGYVGIRFRK